MRVAQCSRRCDGPPIGIDARRDGMSVIRTDEASARTQLDPSE